MATNCGLVVPSGCVPWVSGPLTSFDWKTFTVTNCQPSIGNVIIELDKAIKKMEDTMDMSKVINPGCDCDCITVPVDNTWWNLANSILSCVCELKAKLETPPSTAPRDITNDTVMVDMRCLTGTCSTPPYKVGQVFDTIFAKLCEWDQVIKNCAAGGVPAQLNGSSRVYIPNY